MFEEVSKAKYEVGLDLATVLLLLVSMALAPPAAASPSSFPPVLAAAPGPAVDLAEDAHEQRFRQVLQVGQLGKLLGNERVTLHGGSLLVLELKVG